MKYLLTFLLLVHSLFLDKIVADEIGTFPKTIFSDSFKKAHDELKKNPDDINLQEQYFIQFPNNFETFSYLLGYYEKLPQESNNEDKSGIYYEYIFEDITSGLDMVHIFFKLNKINQNRIYNRIIDIYQNAYWQSDGFGFFMKEVNVILEKSEDKLKQFIKVLSTRPIHTQQEFWRVYFDTPVPMRKLVPSLKGIKKLDGKVYKIMYDVWEKTDKSSYGK